MTLSELIRLNAMHAVVTSDDSYQLREIFRWYSKEYTTPLHIVEELPLEDVLTCYFEDRYKKLVNSPENEEKLLKEIVYLTESDDERKLRKRKEDEEDAELTQGDQAFLKAAQKEAEKQDTETNELPIQSSAIPKKDTQKALLEIEPDVEVQWVDDSEMELELEKADWKLFNE